MTASKIEGINKILESKSYLLAEQDEEFLMSEDVRGIRLELDFLKPELQLKKYGIEHTVVVFGGTRILERSEIKKKINKIEKEISFSPENKGLLRQLKRAQNILKKTHYYDVARELGQIIGNTGDNPQDCTLTLATGGGPGIMEAANRGAADVGAHSIGFNIVLPREQLPNPYITPELCFQFHYFAIRKLHFLKRARALVAFPGGMGTMDELFEALTLVQTGKMDPIPIVMVGEAYWRGVFDLGFMAEEGLIDDVDQDLLVYAETADEAWSYIVDWYKVRGSDLFQL
ncbi:MAG: LOG family protein [bacterium]